MKRLVAIAAIATMAMGRTAPIQTTSAGVVVVVNPDSHSVSLLGEHGKLAEVRVGRNPQTVSVSADERFAFVAARDDGTISVVDLDARALVRSVAVCDEPFGVLPVADRLYVSCASSSQVQVLDAGTFETLADIPTELDPRGLALWKERLLVTHFTSGKVSVIDTSALRVDKVIETLADANLSQSIWIDEQQQLAFLPQTRSNSGNPALLFDTTVFPIVSVIDLQTMTSVPRRRVTIDVADRPVGIPIDAAITADGVLWIVNAASNDVSAISLETGRAVAHFGVGEHPRGLALSPDGSRIYANNTLSGTVSVVDIAARQVVTEIRATRIPLPHDVLNGKRLFNSSAASSLARDRWVACSTCHFDGGMDRRTWFFRDGPRNTPALFGVAQTLPMHWSGDLDELQDVEDTIRVVQAGSGLAAGMGFCDPACNAAPPNAGRSPDLDDLAAFMRSLQVRARTTQLTEGAERGREVFFSSAAGCAACHAPPLFTDLRKHDVGTGGGALERKGSSFDTPSLRGLSDSAPYLHDGSAPSLLDVLTTTNRDDRHGRTSHLTPSQLADLTVFLEQIPVAVVRRRAVR